MSTEDQTRGSALHGEALLAAQDDAFRVLLARLADPDVTPQERAQVAGDLAGHAFAQFGPGVDRVDVGRQLIAAGLLIEAGAIDHDRLAEVVRQAAARHS